MKLSLEHTFDCTPERFWEMYWDDEFDAMMNEDSDISRELLEQDDDGETWYRKVRFTPAQELPSVAARLVGSNKLIYDQESRWDRSQSRIRWKVLPTILPGKLNAEGVFEVRPQKNGKGCTMTVNGDIDVNVRFVGGTIEKAVVAQVASSYDKMASVMRRWLAKNG